MLKRVTSIEYLLRYINNKNKLNYRIKTGKINIYVHFNNRYIEYEECIKIKELFNVNIELLDFRFQYEIENIIENCYTRNQFTKIVGTTKEIISMLINDGYLEIIKLFNNEYILKKDISKYKDSINFISSKCKIKNDNYCVLVNEIERFIKASPINKILLGKLEGEVINGLWYLSYKDLIEFYKIKDSNGIVVYSLDNERNLKNLVSFSQLSLNYKITKDQCIDICNRENIKIITRYGKGRRYQTVEEKDADYIINEFQRIKLYYENKELFFTLEDVHKMLGLTKWQFLENKELLSKITIKEYKKKKYFKCNEIGLMKEILVDQKNRMYYLNGIQAAKELKVCKSILERLVNDGTLKNSKIEHNDASKKYFIAHKDIEEYKKNNYYKYDKNYSTISKIAQEYNVSAKWLSELIERKYYVNKTSYCLIEEAQKIIKLKKGIKIEDSNQNNISIYNNDFESIARMLHISNLTLYELVLKNEFPLTKVISNNGVKQYKFDPKDIKKYKEKYYYAFDSKYCLISEISAEYNYNYDCLKNKIKKIYTYNLRKYCLKKDAIDICEKMIKKQQLYEEVVEKDNKSAAFEYYKLRYRDGLRRYINTIKLFDLFIKQEINKSRAKNLINIVYNNGKTLIVLISKLEKVKKEIYELNSFQLEEVLFNDGFGNSALQISIGKFINFVKSKAKNKCKYTTTIKRKSTVSSNKREIYEYDLFIKFAEYIANCNIHVKSSLNNSKYAQIWLYSIFHFCTAWRSGDILEFPCFTEIESLVNNINWFETHTLSEKDCEIIIKMFNDNYFVANKNKNVIPFQVFKLFKLSFGTAIVICEMHRKNKNEDLLFFHFKRYRPTRKEIQKFLEKSDSLPSYSSLALNRSFISNYYDYTSSHTELHKLAYYLSRKLRGHITNDMTWQYINSLPNEDINECSYLIFENDTFGYIKYYLAEMIALSDNDKFNLMNLTEKREYMIEKYNLPNILKIEAFSKTLLLEQQLKINIIDELLKYSKVELFENLGKIYRGVNLASVKDVQCINPDRCQYRLNIIKHCENCVNAIYNKQFLYELNRKIIRTLEFFNDNTSHTIIDFKKRIIYLQKILCILRQALDETIGFGKDVVNEYINLMDLKERLDKFLLQYCIQKIEIQIQKDNIDYNKIIDKMPADIIILYEQLNGETELITKYKVKLLLISINRYLVDILERSKSKLNEKNIRNGFKILNDTINKLIVLGFDEKRIGELVDFKKIKLLLD